MKIANTLSILLATVLGAGAVMFASINVVGGYLVTNRMLSMFKKKDSPSAGDKK